MMAESDKQVGSEEKPVSEEIPELFHYTSIASLQAILRSQSLWATQATHLSDTTETKLIWPRIAPAVVDFYRRELAKLVQHDADARNFVADNGGVAQVAQYYAFRSVDTVRTQMLGDTSRPAPRVFIVSFSTHSGNDERDDYHRQHGMLSQWRGYGGDDGVAIVFDASGVENLLRAEERRFECWPMSLSTVIYGSNDLNLEERFDTLFAAWGNFVRTIIKTDGGAPGREDLEASARLIDKIGPAFPRFKHPAFHEESECRIVVGVIHPLIPADEESGGSHRSKAQKTVHYRAGRSGSIPYIKLFERSEGELPITRIIVGPSRNQQANLETVQGIVRSMGIEVSASETPFVGSSGR